MADVAEDLNALAKTVFGDDGVPDLIPQETQIQKDIPFSASDKIGDKYEQAVRLAYPSGFTHALGDGSAGAFTFNDVVGGVQKKAEVKGYQTLLRDWMSYEDAAKLTSSKQAFKNGAAFFFEGLQSAARRRLEVLSLYGGQGIGQGDTSVNSSATATVVTLTAASFAAGIWSGSVGTKVQFYSLAGTLISTGADSVFTVSGLNLPLMKVTVTGTATGITALDTALGSGNCDIYYNGAKGKEAAGVVSILSNTGSLFGISAADYDLWKSAQYAQTSGAASFANVKKAITLAVGNGLMEDLKLYMNPGAWDDICTEIAALRQTDAKSVNTVDVGTEKIVFHTQAGKAELVPHLFVKGGHILGLTPKHWKRIGSTDLTTEAPGMGKMFMHLPNNAGVESRMYTHQGMICMKPAKQLIITGVVNS